MAQREVEMILMRQLGSYLAMPVFITDPVGNLVFFNEPAEALLGRRFEETGEMPATEWATLWTPTDEADVPLPPDALPLSIALTERRPSNRSLWIRGLDNVRHYVEIVAFPLIGQGGRYLGAVAIMWEAGA